MLDRLPEMVEPWGLAEAGRSFHGRVPVNGLLRLAPMLSNSSGELDVALTFGIDERRIAVVSGNIAGNLSLICQRCLDSMDCPLKLNLQLGIVHNENQLDQLPEGYEPLQITGEPISVAELIEDEILLALPAIPTHADNQHCETGYRNQTQSETRKNPFAVLEQLKSRT